MIACATVRALSPILRGLSCTPTPPPKPPAATTPAPVVPPAPAPLPEIKKPKLSWAERNTLNKALESAQEWLGENEAAIRAQSHALLDRVLKPVGEWIGRAHPAVDDAIGWAVAKVAALKF